MMYLTYQYHLNNQKIESAIKTEFDRYIEDEAKIDKDMNILNFWNENKSSYPILAKQLDVFYAFHPQIYA